MSLYLFCKCFHLCGQFMCVLLYVCENFIKRELYQHTLNHRQVYLSPLLHVSPSSLSSLSFYCVYMITVCCCCHSVLSRLKLCRCFFGMFSRNSSLLNGVVEHCYWLLVESPPPVLFSQRLSIILLSLQNTKMYRLKKYSRKSIEP